LTEGIPSNAESGWGNGGRVQVGEGAGGREAVPGLHQTS